MRAAVLCLAAALGAPVMLAFGIFVPVALIYQAKGNLPWPWETPMTLIAFIGSLGVLYVAMQMMSRGIRGVEEMMES